MATLDAPKVLVLTNHTKLNLTETLTINDTVTVIFYTHFVDTHKKVIAIIKEIFAEAREWGSWVGPFFPFSDFLPVS